MNILQWDLGEGDINSSIGKNSAGVTGNTSYNGSLYGSNNSYSTVIQIVNINTATQTELETLPGIGPSLALKIIRYREENGKFNNIEDLKNVSGIGDNRFNDIKDYITV